MNRQDDEFPADSHGGDMEKRWAVETREDYERLVARELRRQAVRLDQMRLLEEMLELPSPEGTQ